MWLSCDLLAAGPTHSEQQVYSPCFQSSSELLHPPLAHHCHSLPTNTHFLVSTEWPKPLSMLLSCTWLYTSSYRRYGNFCVRKLLYDKFSCWKFFVGTTPYHVNVNSVHEFFVRLISIAAIDYENIFTTIISRFLVCVHVRVLNARCLHVSGSAFCWVRFA